VSGFTDTEITAERPRLLKELGGDRYLDPGRYEQELRTVFTNSWLMAARLDELPRSGALQRQVGGRPLALTRDGETIRTLHNVCSHRGCAVVADRIEGASLRCPFHGWTYGLDGRVIALPGQSRFKGLDLNECALPMAHCRTLSGIVWVSFATQPPPLETWLGRWADELARYQMEAQSTVTSRSCEVAANWKVCVDAFNETYHVPFTHGETVSRFVEGRASRFTYAGPHSRMVVPVRRRSSGDGDQVIDGGRRQGGKDLLPEQEHDHVNYTLLPNLILDLLATWGIALQFEPLDVSRTEIRTWMITDRGRQDDELADQWTQFCNVMDEDLEILAATARGMRSPMFRAVRLGGEEERLVHFHEQIDRLLEVEPTAP
jgi:phenylpropionate dioxygenase-like ring-hydroxylating dioxygenase large terminal subunit